MNLANFRDLGGMQTTDGKQVKRHRLLRSGEIVTINQVSKERLAQHQLTKIIDLRSKEEIESKPDDHLEQVDYRWIDIMKDVQENASMDQLFQMNDLVAVDRHMKQIYFNLVQNKGAQKGYQEFIHQLLETEQGGVLFHCFAGKDRTGMAAVFALSLLEVPAQAIMQDYLLTNQQRAVPNQLYLAQLEKEGLTPEQLAGVKVALEVTPSYLEYANQLIQKDFGGMRPYTKEILGISDTEQAALKALYLE